MVACKKYSRKKEKKWKNVFILYKNLLPDETYFIRDRNIAVFEGNVSTEPIVTANEWRLKYIEADPIYHKFLNIVVDKTFYKFKTSVQNRKLWRIECFDNSNRDNMLLSSTRSFTYLNNTDNHPVVFSQNNGMSIDVNDFTGLNCAILQKIAYNSIYSDDYDNESSRMFIYVLKCDQHLKKICCNNVELLKNNHLFWFQKQSRNETLFRFESLDIIWKENTNTPLSVAEKKNTYYKIGKRFRDWKNIHYKFKPKKPLATNIRHWHIRDTFQGYTLRNILKGLYINSLTYIRNKYFVIIIEAKFITNTILQMKSLIVAFCEELDTFVDKLLRVNKECKHFIICATSLKTFKNFKEVLKEDTVIETLQAVMYSRGSTTSSNIAIPRNYLLNRNYNASKSLKNSSSDLKNLCIMDNNIELGYGGFKSFAILSIDNLLEQHYNIMQTQTPNNLSNQNNPDEKVHCNSTLTVGRIWLRNFFRDSKNIKAHFNMALNMPHFVNETMFGTPLLVGYLELVNQVYKTLTTQSIYKNTVKSLGQHFLYIIFSSR